MIEDLKRDVSPIREAWLSKYSLVKRRSNIYWKSVQNGKVERLKGRDRQKSVIFLSDISPIKVRSLYPLPTPL